MNVEAGVLVVGHLHHRRRRRNHHQTRAVADPIDMPVTVHQELRGRPGAASRPPHEPVAVDQRGSDPLRQRLCRPWIFDEVVVQGEDPAGARKLLGPISRPLTCSLETMPSALVKEKCVLALKLMSRTPKLSSGGAGAPWERLRPRSPVSPTRRALSHIGEAAIS